MNYQTSLDFEPKTKSKIEIFFKESTEFLEKNGFLPIPSPKSLADPEIVFKHQTGLITLKASGDYFKAYCTSFIEWFLQRDDYTERLSYFEQEIYDADNLPAIIKAMDKRTDPKTSYLQKPENH